MLHETEPVKIKAVLTGMTFGNLQLYYHNLLFFFICLYFVTINCVKQSEQLSKTILYQSIYYFECMHVALQKLQSIDQLASSCLWKKEKCSAV